MLFGERSHADPNYKTFNDQGWGEPLDQQGWWGASTSRKMIGHVTLERLRADQLPASLSYTRPRKARIRRPTVSATFNTTSTCGCAPSAAGIPKGRTSAFADGSGRFLANRDRHRRVAIARHAHRRRPREADQPLAE